MDSEDNYEIREELEYLFEEAKRNRYGTEEFEERALELGLDSEEMNTAEKLAYGETLVNIIQEDYENIEQEAEKIVEGLESLERYQETTYEIAINNTENLREVTNELSRLAEHTTRIDEELEDIKEDGPREYEWDDSKDSGFLIWVGKKVGLDNNMAQATETESDHDDSSSRYESLKGYFSSLFNSEENTADFNTEEPFSEDNEEPGPDWNTDDETGQSETVDLDPFDEENENQGDDSDFEHL